MKKFLLYFAAVAMLGAGVFSSCGKDDPEESKKKLGPDPVAEWTTVEHEGFSFKIRTSEVNTPDGKNAVAKMKLDLSEINKIIPAAALKVMKSQPIWLERNIQENGAAWYHTSKEYLAQQGYMMAKWHCVEISNFVNYYKWSRQNQPYMVLHELCHLYHDQGIAGGFNNEDILAAYNHAKDSGMYKGTAYRYNTYDPESSWNYTITENGAYCLNSVAEYFSEMCEAYWGENDYYPFNYEQLKEYDELAFAVMEKIWGKRPDKQK